MEDFFTILKRKRAEKYTQTEFARVIGVSDTQLQNYESTTLPPHDRLQKINQALNYDFSRHIYQQHVGAAADTRFDELYNDMCQILDKYKGTIQQASNSAATSSEAEDEETQSNPDHDKFDGHEYHGKQAGKKNRRKG